MTSALTGLGPRIESEFDQAARRVAEEVAKRVKQRIRSQAYGHAPLSPKYRAWKIKKGLSPKILIATGQYVGSIRAWKEGRGSWHAGVTPGARHSSGVDMQQLAVWLEYGTSRMPARPHWRIELEWAEKQMMFFGARAMRKAVHR